MGFGGEEACSVPRRLESTSSHCVATLAKLLTHNCLRGRQWETTSLISSPGGVKENEPAFRHRTIIIITKQMKQPFVFVYATCLYRDSLSLSYTETCSHGKISNAKQKQHCVPPKQNLTYILASACEMVHLNTNYSDERL